MTIKNILKPTTTPTPTPVDMKKFSGTIQARQSLILELKKSLMALLEKIWPDNDKANLNANLNTILNTIYISADQGKEPVPINKYVSDLNKTDDKNCLNALIARINNIKKDTKTITKMITLAGANSISINKGYIEPKNLLQIIIESEPSKDTNSNIVVSQGPVNPQDIDNPNKGVSKTGKALTVDEKENGSKFAYKDTCIEKMLNELGYNV